MGKVVLCWVVTPQTKTKQEDQNDHVEIDEDALWAEISTRLKWMGLVKDQKDSKK